MLPSLLHWQHLPHQSPSQLHSSASPPSALSPSLLAFCLLVLKRLTLTIFVSLSEPAGIPLHSGEAASLHQPDKQGGEQTLAQTHTCKHRKNTLVHSFWSLGYHMVLGCHLLAWLQTETLRASNAWFVAPGCDSLKACCLPRIEMISVWIIRKFAVSATISLQDIVGNH